jgi:hypothetical protein
MDISNLRIFVCTVVIVLFSSSFVFALGISSPYWKNNPLEMKPGDSKDVSFTLVNRLGEPNAEAFVSMVEDAGVATITSGDEYLVQPGTTNTKVVLRITIPNDAMIGEAYEVEFAVKSKPEAEEGSVHLGVGYNVDFPINVVSETEEESLIPDTLIETPEEGETGVGVFVFWILLFVVLVFVLYWIFGRKKSSQV